jgi:hypothetical protein
MVTCAEEEGGTVNSLVGVDGWRLLVQLGARGRGDNGEPFPRLGRRPERLGGGWPRRAELARRRAKQSIGGTARGRRKCETTPSAGNARTSKDQSTWVVATCGIWSPLRHRTWCHMCMRKRSVRPVKRRLRLTSGPRLHFIISMILNHPNFEI